MNGRVKLMARLGWLGLIFFAGPLLPAQTNGPDATTPGATNAPAAAAPVVPDGIPDGAGPFVAPGSSAQPSASQDDDIYDIRPPFFYLHSWFWLWIALAAAALVALLVYLLKTFKSNRLLSPKTAYDLALEKLEKARALLREDNPMPYAVAVSEAVRTYLGQRFSAPSTRRTTEEFLHQMESDLTAPLAEHRELLRGFLQSCDLVKFARYQPTRPELEQVQDRAVTFVTATKPVPETVHANGRSA
jgi:hypothetical protein